MGTVLREVMVTPPYAARRLLFDFAQQNPLLNTLFVAPGKPTFPNDLSFYRPGAKWNSAVYFDPPNVTIRLPPYVPGTPVFPPDFGPKLTGPLRNASLYFDPPNVTINAQAGFIGSPVIPVDLTPRLVARQPLNIEYPPNLSVAILNSNPYVPVDLSGQAPIAKRNASLYFDSPNITVNLSSGQMPIVPVDWNNRFSVRQPITFDAPNLASLLSTGLMPVAIVDNSLPVRAAARSASLYEAQGSLLATSLFSPALLPLAVLVEVGYRYWTRRNPSGAEWVEPQRALLSAPILLANIPNLAYRKNSGTQVYNAGLSFSGATSYAIAPALDAGITFNTVTGAITTDTHVASVSTHGPYTITATNTNGSQASNAFTITVSAGNYQVDGDRVTKSTTAAGTTYTLSGPATTRDTPESEDLT